MWCCRGYCSSNHKMYTLYSGALFSSQAYVEPLLEHLQTMLLTSTKPEMCGSMEQIVSTGPETLSLQTNANEKKFIQTVLWKHLGDRSNLTTLLCFPNSQTVLQPAREAGAVLLSTLKTMPSETTLDSCATGPNGGCNGQPRHRKALHYCMMPSSHRAATNSLKFTINWKALR